MKKLGLLLALVTLVGCSLVEEPVEEEADESLIEEEPVVVEEPLSVVILVNKLNVRESYTTDSQVVGQVTNGEVFLVAHEATDSGGRVWYKIKGEDFEGYVAGWYTTDASDYKEQFRYAYLNSMEVARSSMSETVSEMFSKLGDPDVSEAITGALYYTYGNVTYFSDSLAYKEGNIIMISYIGTESVYGVRKGETLNDLVGVLGEPDSINDLTEDSIDELFGGLYVVVYNAGDNQIKFLFESKESTLQSIVLQK